MYLLSSARSCEENLNAINYLTKNAYLKYFCLVCVSTKSHDAFKIFYHVSLKYFKLYAKLANI